MNIRRRSHGSPRKHGEMRVSLVLKAESYAHVWPATGKWVHNKASLWYVPHSSIKLFNKIEPVPAIFEVYDHGLDGHSANNGTHSVLVP